VFSGYWGRPDETEKVLSPDGWYRSGDVVRVDDDGWAQVVDRVKDVIISGGENVYPAEVEAVIAELDDVRAVAVVAAPDPKWGEVGCAYVVLRPGSDLGELALRAHLDQRLARYKIPRHLEFLEELPTNATGKVLRAALREQARHDHPSPTTTTETP
jgi:fatty-acyl-CoA synthase